MSRNHAREGGGAVFFVSNDRIGTLGIRCSKLQHNRSDGFENAPGIFFFGRQKIVKNSVLKELSAARPAATPPRSA